MQENKIIDIDNVIKSKSKRLYAILPRFIISYLKKIVHEDGINSVLNKNKDYIGVDFAIKVLADYDIKIESIGKAYVENNDRLIIASNHPLGGLDGMAIMSDIGKLKPIKTLANDLLMHVENFKSLFIPINKHGKNPKSNIIALNETFEPDINILYFPAGLVSRKKGKIIKDLEWKKSFIQKSVKNKRDIIPTYVNGRNTDFFYNLANWRKRLGIKANIEMFFLVDEMYKNIDTTIKIIYGKPISYKVFDKRMDDLKWAQEVKEHCYDLSLDCNAEFKFQ